MKRVFSFIAALFISGSFLFTPGLVGAVSDLDQYMTDGVGGNYIFTHQYSGQSFKPTKSRLNKVSLKLKGDGGLVYIQMTKTGDATLLLPGTPLVDTAVDADFKWYDFSFSDVAVTPGTSYTIWAAVNTGSNTFWAIQSAEELYPNGKAYIDCPTWVSTDACDHWVATADWTFKTYGYSTETPPPPAAPAAKPPVAAEAPAPTTVATIAAPVLTELKKNNTIVTLPVKDPVKITKAGKLGLAGTSAAGAAVSLSWGDKTYPATSAADGSWKIEVVAKDLPVGDYTVKGKTVKGSTSSAEVELLKFKVETNAEVEVASTKVWVKDVNLYYAGAAGLLLLIAVILLIVYAVKHRKLKKHVESLGGSEAPAKDEKVEEPKE